MMLRVSQIKVTELKTKLIITQMGIAYLKRSHIAAFPKHLKCICLKLHKTRVYLFIYSLRISFSYCSAD